MRHESPSPKRWPRRPVHGVVPSHGVVGLFRAEPKPGKWANIVRATTSSAAEAGPAFHQGSGLGGRALRSGSRLPPKVGVPFARGPDTEPGQTTTDPFDLGGKKRTASSRRGD